MARSFDIVLFGATGFTGRFAFEHLVRHCPLTLKLAIAGRNRVKLEAVRDLVASSLADGPRKTKTKEIPILIADSSDQASLDSVAGSTKVILSTVGPFALYGTPLVDACVRFGTHYVDSTGETPWIKELIEKYEDAAIEKNVKIVPSCGFDSLPSDIGAFLIADHFAKQGKATESVRSVVMEVKGGISGGTIATIANMIESSSFSKLAKSGDPYALISKTDVAKLPSPGNPVVLHYNSDVKRYETIFVMAPGNSAYVRRSYALLNRAYGSKFKYTEALATNTNYVTALVQVLTMLSVMVSFLLPPVRYVVKRLVPQGSNSASEAALRAGGGTIKYIGTAEDGSKALAQYKINVDVGYVGTGMMLAESAMCLALDEVILETGKDHEVGSFGVKSGGILTAASAMGLVIVERLKNVGIEISVGNV
ncbi:hypothetical protein BCR33DRAFT_712213 [Rhizoclosmatium globosum]|uniref:Saccharopine dehydrogenase NADP binding domain-containing protein n=1 Tax=Rhizoclosmatium globosum TaxID=329046 RepID=A0A1Y2D084_9FUNG|nr:hypothetical protein HDU99_001934 [Rhizoclosmatium hyalinum]KAJ3297522.1 hypothetical protein HDU79_003029 [Rhizoclosmatium sp. JEL0117]ORY52005.1 hypothetical protein BCR33DRAFT_712213 [Rhizoclosmatium globosum]|eukprot:ORY52005.1 hypothetical protein BCR33DRAFT_712213 [Rhizoclosmatium globosum]